MAGRASGFTFSGEETLGNVAAIVTLPGMDWAPISCQALGQAPFLECPVHLRTSPREVLSPSPPCTSGLRA